MFGWLSVCAFISASSVLIDGGGPLMEIMVLESFGDEVGGGCFDLEMLPNDSFDFPFLKGRRLKEVMANPERV